MYAIRSYYGGTIQSTSEPLMPAFSNASSATSASFTTDASLVRLALSDPDRLARFEREARTLAQLTHPNVAGIYGVEEHEVV